MKYLNVLITPLVAICLSGTVAWAQRGRGGGAPGGAHGPAMPPPSANSGAGMNRHGAADNGSMHDSSSARSGSAAHGTSVASHLENNAALSSRLGGLLPAGANLQQESAGFRNLGQFAATLHASKNLNLPFDQLKARMTGPNQESLGKAIHDLRPDLDSKAVKSEVRTAEKASKEDLKEAGEK